MLHGREICSVEFMENLLEPATLATRIERYVTHEAESGTFPRRSFPLIREAVSRSLALQSGAAWH